MVIIFPLNLLKVIYPQSSTIFYKCFPYIFSLFVEKISWENLEHHFGQDTKNMHNFVTCLLVKKVLNDEELHLHAFARGNALVSNLDHKNLYIRKQRLKGTDGQF